MATLRHPLVSLRIARRNFPAMLASSKTISNAVTAAGATFVTLTPSTTTVNNQIQALDLAQQAALTHGKGLAAARDLKADALMTSLESWRAGVQVLVDANPEQAQALAELAGMFIAGVGARSKPVLALELGTQSGVVEADANLTLLKKGRGKAKKTTINWRYNVNGAATYVSSSTPLASTVFSGLTPLTTLGVQVCITDADGTTEWSQAVTILVR
jgi:hypothetical protein